MLRIKNRVVRPQTTPRNNAAKTSGGAPKVSPLADTASPNPTPLVNPMSNRNQPGGGDERPLARQYISIATRYTMMHAVPPPIQIAKPNCTHSFAGGASPGTLPAPDETPPVGAGCAEPCSQGLTAARSRWKLTVPAASPAMIPSAQRMGAPGPVTIDAEQLIAGNATASTPVATPAPPTLRPRSTTHSQIRSTIPARVHDGPDACLQSSGLLSTYA